MKKLICARDVEAVKNQGKKVIQINENTIITPSAQDLAKASGIEFSKEMVLAPKIQCNEKLNNFDVVKEVQNLPKDGLNSDMVYNVLKAMMDKGLINGLFDTVNNPKSYVEESTSGLKVVRGNTVKYDVFDTGNPNSKVSYQELISKDESSMSAGFLTIDNSKFDWELTYEEIDYVIEGTISVTINGKTLTAYPGDVLYVPSGSKVTWCSSDKARLFYVTYPANWADL